MNPSGFGQRHQGKQNPIAPMSPEVPSFTATEKESHSTPSIWSILNSRLVVVLLALLLWPICAAMTSGIAMKLGISQVVKAVSSEVVKPFQNMGAKQNEEIKQAVRIMDKITVTNLAFAPTSWKNQAKVIGTLTNHSGHSVKSLHLQVSTYKNGKLVDVQNEWLSKIKILKSGGVDNFTFTIRYKNDKMKPTSLPKVKVSDLQLIK